MVIALYARIDDARRLVKRPVRKQPAGGQNGGESRAGLMDHQYIEGHNIPDRYLQGTLSATERIRFEEHFINCAECLDRLEMTEDFRGALRTVAAEGAATARVNPRPGSHAWFTGIPVARPAALFAAAAVLLLVALPALLLIVWTEQSRRQVDQARLSAADWQRKFEESQQAGRKAEAEMQAREQELATQRLEIEAREREAQARVPEAQGRQSLLHTAPIFALHTVRGGTREQSAPSTRITIPRSAQWIVLTLEIEPDPELQSYRATLFTSAERVICRVSDVVPVKGALAVSCDSSLFSTGDYRLALEGLTRQGRHVSAGAYAFHVIKQ